jgi:HEAT repeat protein
MIDIFFHLPTQSPPSAVWEWITAHWFLALGAVGLIALFFAVRAISLRLRIRDAQKMLDSKDITALLVGLRFRTKEKDYKVSHIRSNAAKVLWRLNQDPAVARRQAPIIQGLIRAIDDIDSNVRRPAAGALADWAERLPPGHLRQKAVQALARTVRDSDSDTRILSMQGLARWAFKWAILPGATAQENGNAAGIKAALKVLALIQGKTLSSVTACYKEDGNAEVRAAAAVTLGVMADRDVLQVLNNSLAKETSEKVRTAALEAIGMSNFPQAVELLEEQLVSGQPADRKGTAAILEKRSWSPGSERLAAALAIATSSWNNLTQSAGALAPLLVDNLKHGDFGGWGEHFADALAGIGTPAVAEIARATVPPTNSIAQRWAAVSLGRIGKKAADPRIARLLVPLLDDPSPSVFDAAIEALWLTRDPTAVVPIKERLDTAIQKGDDARRDALLYALETTGEPAIPALVDVLFQPVVTAGELSAQVLCRLKWHPGHDKAAAYYWMYLRNYARCLETGEDAPEALLLGMTFGSDAQRKQAAEALVKGGRDPLAVGKILPMLRALLKSKDKQNRQLAVWVLGELDAPEALQALGEALTAPETHDQVEQIYASLEKIGRKALEYVVVALDCDDPILWKAAAKLLKQWDWTPSLDARGARYHINEGNIEACAEIGQAAAPALLQVYRTGTAPDQETAVQALAKIGDPQAAVLLTEAAFKYNKDKDLARKYLSQFGAAAIQPIIPYLANGGYENRLAAANMLVEIYNRGPLSEKERSQILNQRALITQPHIDRQYDHTDEHTDISRSSDCDVDYHTDDSKHEDTGIGLSF